MHFLVILFVNRFSTDTPAELNLVRDLCLAEGAYAAVVANHWAEGGKGAVDLGKAVIEACAAAKSEGTGNFKLVYQDF